MSDETKEMKVFEVMLCSGATFNVKAREVERETYSRPTDPVTIFKNSYSDIQASIRDSDMLCWRVL